MDQRAEPRFPVYLPAKIFLPHDSGRELNCFLADLSASGIKLLADEALPTDEIIGVEVEHHLVLAEVRHSLPRGSKFVIGAERIHAALKLELPSDGTKLETIQALIDDFHLRVRNELASTESAADLSFGSDTLQMQPQPQEYFEEPGLGAEIPVTPPQETELAGPAPPASLPESAQKSDAAPGPTVPLDAPITNVVLNKDEIPKELSIEHYRELAARRMAEAPRPRRSVRFWLISAGFAAVLTILGLSAVFFVLKDTHQLPSASSAERNEPKAQSTQKPEQVLVADSATPTTPAAAQSTRSPEQTSPAPVRVTPSLAQTSAAPIPMPLNASRKRHASIKATEASWVSACSDGKEVFARLFLPNDKREIEFSERAVMRVGNAGGVEITLEGKPIEMVGGPGRLREIEFSPGGFQFRPVPPGNLVCIPASVSAASSKPRPE
jgi:hypothetical protein